MCKHQAGGQMIGYFYQARYALYLLLKNANPDYQIAIEKFDDVSFERDGDPVELIQVKHHLGKPGNLGDSSVDLWRTLKVWIDTLNKTPDLVESINFCLITTETAKDQSAVFYLKEINRDPNRAYEILKAIAENDLSKSNEKFYSAFKEMKQDLAKKMISKIYVLDGEVNILSLEDNIKKEIKYCCKPQYMGQVFERLEGFWAKNVIKALCSDDPVLFNQRQLHSKIVEISQEYSDNNLPIEEFFADEVDIDQIEQDKRIFYEQLKLISLSENRLRMAVNDYYRAYRQRSSWVRNELLYVDELDCYEARLVDEWKHSFYKMEDDLQDLDTITEKEKQKAGKKLFNEIEDQNIPIREKCGEPFITRGSYHILANGLKVGWHIDFLDRLKELLKI